jgi:hypothetical protein
MNPNVQYRLHNSPPLVPIHSYIKPIHAIPSCSFKMYFNIRKVNSRGFFLSVLPAKWLQSFITPLTNATCPTHLTRLDLIVPITLS